MASYGCFVPELLGKIYQTGIHLRPLAIDVSRNGDVRVC